MAGNSSNMRTRHQSNKTKSKKPSGDSKNFYSVSCGRVCGIFTHWSSASQSVYKYPNCRHKGFQNLCQAVEFMLSDSNINHTRSSIRVYVNEDKEGIPLLKYESNLGNSSPSHKDKDTGNKHDSDKPDENVDSDSTISPLIESVIEKDKSVPPLKLDINVPSIKPNPYSIKSNDSKNPLPKRPRKKLQTKTQADGFKTDMPPVFDFSKPVSALTQEQTEVINKMSESLHAIETQYNEIVSNDISRQLEINDLVLKTTSLQKDMDNVQSQLGAERKYCDNLIAQYQLENRELKSENGNLKRQCLTLQEQYSDIKSAAQVHNKEIEHKNNIIDQLQTELSHLKSDLTQAKNELSHLTAMKMDNETKTNEIAALKNQLDENKTELNRAKFEISNYQKRINETEFLKITNTTIANELSQAKQELHKTKRALIQAKNDHLQTENDLNQTTPEHQNRNINGANTTNMDRNTPQNIPSPINTTFRFSDQGLSEKQTFASKVSKVKQNNESDKFTFSVDAKTFKPSTQQNRENPIRETKTPVRNAQPVENIDCLIITDSIGKDLKGELLYTNKKCVVKLLPNGTMYEAHHYINNNPQVIKNSKSVVLILGHTEIGTQPTSDCITDIKNLIELLQEINPMTEIIVTPISERAGGSELNDSVKSYNTVLKRECPTGVHLIDRRIVAYKGYLYDWDGKHLNEKGNRELVRAIKTVVNPILGLPPYITNRRNRSDNNGDRQNQTGRNRNLESDKNRGTKNFDSDFLNKLLTLKNLFG